MSRQALMALGAALLVASAAAADVTDLRVAKSGVDPLTATLGLTWTAGAAGAWHEVVSRTHPALPIEAGVVLAESPDGRAEITVLGSAWLVVRPRACSDDAAEDDDAPSTALLPPWSSGAPGRRSCLGDDDWFRASLLCDESAWLRIDYDPAAGRLALDLLEGDPPVLASTSSTGTGHEEQSAWTGTTTDFWFRVRNIGSTDVDYVFDGFAPWEGCLSDDHGIDDTSATARSGWPDVSGDSDDLCPCGDVDVYALRLEAGRTVAITLGDQGGGCVESLRGDLLDVDGATVIDAVPTGGGFLDSPVAGTGTYFFRVSCGPGGSDEAYVVEFASW